MANDAALVTTRRQGWDAPERSAAQERFYRELMAVDRLPSAPEIAQRLLVAINREDAHTRHLTALIVRDQSLSARLLRLANSAFFSIRTRVTSIHHATTLLGFARVRDLALGLSVWGALESKSPEARRWRRVLWSHTSLVAATAKTLAERTGNDANTAFTAGLLHDVGKLVLGIRLGDSYWSLLDEAAGDGREGAELEAEAFGCHRSRPTADSTFRRWSRWRTGWSTLPIPRAASRATRCSTRSGRSRRGCSRRTRGPRCTPAWRGSSTRLRASLRGRMAGWREGAPPRLPVLAPRATRRL